MHGVNPLCIAAQSSRFTSSHQVVGQRTESDRTADGIRSDGGRNPIGRRTESDRAANGIRSDGGRNPVPIVGAHHNFCGFRGRFFSASNSVRSVDSVGKPTQPNHLCRVKSVGEHEYSHRIRRTHRTFWLRWASHRLHRFSQIRRVWHPCHTHAANSAP